MKKILFTVFILTSIFQTFAQSAKLDVIATSGDYFKNSTYSLSWTLGECVTETFVTTGNTLTQGFQQSSYFVTSINELSTEGFYVKAYPNPVSDLINISVKNEHSIQKNVRIKLFDSNGKILFLKKISSDLIQLNMSEYSSGFYLLKVEDPESKIHQNFKIQKIN